MYCLTTEKAARTSCDMMDWQVLIVIGIICTSDTFSLCVKTETGFYFSLGFVEEGFSGPNVEWALGTKKYVSIVYTIILGKKSTYTFFYQWLYWDLLSSRFTKLLKKSAQRCCILACKCCVWCISAPNHSIHKNLNYEKNSRLQKLSSTWACCKHEWFLPIPITSWHV